MEREEILKKIRESNEMEMPLETDAVKSGWEIGALISGLAGALIFCLEWLFLDKINFGIILTLSLSLTAMNVIAAVRLRTVPRCTIAVFLCLLTLMVTVFYVLSFSYGWL